MRANQLRPHRRRREHPAYPLWLAEALLGGKRHLHGAAAEAAGLLMQLWEPYCTPKGKRQLREALQLTPGPAMPR